MPFTIIDPGADRVVGTADDQTFQTLGRCRPAPARDRVYTNPERQQRRLPHRGVALNRRFSGKWMMLTSFGYTWSTMHAHRGTRAPGTRVHRTARSTDCSATAAYETTTLWNYKVIGRYMMPWDIGFSGSWKVQSGFNYGRTISVAFPVEGARTIRVEPIDREPLPDASRSSTSALDKTFTFGKFGKAHADARRVQHA